MIKFKKCYLAVVTSLIIALQSCAKIPCSVDVRQNFTAKYHRIDALRQRSSGNMLSDSPCLHAKVLFCLTGRRGAMERGAGPQLQSFQ